MRYVKMLFLLALFFLTVVLLAQNMEALSAPLTVSLALFGTPVFDFSQPVYLYLLTLAVAGAALCTLYFLCEKVRLSRELSKARKKIGDLEQEVNSLRNLPLEPAGFGAEAQAGE
ncbi:lipopolysaccharide assembly protein LapA domain-containing protein [Desulfocurvus sp. DL9XJH121]